MAKAESTIKNMIAKGNAISKPAYEYFDQDEVKQEIDNIKQR